MRVLVTGTQGQLAMALREAGAQSGVDLVCVGRPELDLSVPDAIAAGLTRYAPTFVMNAAAYTAVDKAESEPKVAEAINAAGAGAVAAACADMNIPILHISTDYVFDGTSSRPYREDDQTGPTSAYGRSKLAGELAVARANPRHIILRTAWVHSPWGGNFIRTMLRLGAMRPEISIVDDQHGCPTYAPHLAEACIAVAQAMHVARTEDRRWGVYHATDSGETTWCGLAREIFRVAQTRGAAPVTLKAISTADYPTPAKRPANSRLDGTKLAATYGVRLPDWRDGVDACVSRLVAS